MTSQDTRKYAEDEMAKADSFQKEIEKEQANLRSLETISDAGSDIDAKNQIIASLEAKKHQHLEVAERLQQQSAEEERQELREQAKEGDKGNILKEGAKEAFMRGFLD